MSSPNSASSGFPSTTAARPSCDCLARPRWRLIIPVTSGTYAIRAANQNGRLPAGSPHRKPTLNIKEENNERPFITRCEVRVSGCGAASGKRVGATGEAMPPLAGASLAGLGRPGSPDLAWLCCTVLRRDFLRGCRLVAPGVAAELPVVLHQLLPGDLHAGDVPPVFLGLQSDGDSHPAGPRKYGRVVEA